MIFRVDIKYMPLWQGGKYMFNSNKDDLSNDVWMSIVNRKYLGIRKMKYIAKIILNDPELFTKFEETFFVEYKKFRLSEWLTWCDSTKCYKIYKERGGKIHFTIKEDLSDLGAFQETVFQVYDQNLNLMYDSNKFDDVYETYEKKYKFLWSESARKYMQILNVKKENNYETV